jgi:Mg-chelatase subunit ChlD/DNA-binding beta-propeller fold protein YncE
VFSIAAILSGPPVIIKESPMSPRTRALLTFVAVLVLSQLLARAALAQAPPEAYQRVATWTAQPQPRAAGELTAAAGIDVAPDGTIYVVDQADGVVQVLSSSGRGLRTIGRPGSQPGQLDAPADVDEADGRLYVTDTGNGRIQVFDAASGGFLAAWTNLGRPWGIAVTADRVYVSDAARPQVRVLSRSGAAITSWGPREPIVRPFQAPRGLAVDSSGRVYVADPTAQAIFITEPDGSSAGELTRALETYYQPVDVAVRGTTVYGVSWRLVFAYDALFGLPLWRALPHYHLGGQGIAIGPGNGLVTTVQDPRSVFSGVQYHPDRDVLSREVQRWGTVPVAVGVLSAPRRLSVAGDGSVYLLDAWPRLQRWSAAGVPQSQLRVEASTDIAAALNGDVFLVDSQSVSRISPDGSAVWSAAVDQFGTWLLAAAATDRLTVVDAGLNRLVDFGPTGQQAETAVGGLLVDVAAGGGKVLVADRAVEALRLLDARGQELARWAFPGRVTRLAGARDGSAWFVLTADGWVRKYGPAGGLRAAWDGAPEGSPVDLDVDLNGRVYVADGTGDRIFVYAPDPGGTSPLPPAPGDRCDLIPDKTAQPAQVTVGMPVTVTLTVTGDCPSESVDLDIVLVLDRSGSMEGQKMAAAKSAAVAFTTEMDFRRVRLALEIFSGSAAVLQPLTDDPDAIVRAVSAVQASGDTNIGEAIRTAATELASSRARPGAQRVIVLLTDGRPQSPTEARSQAILARAAGITLFTIGLGADLDPDLLRELAGSDDRYFGAPTEADLAHIFTRIARRLVTTTLLRAVTVTDVLPANMEYVPSSAVPPATWDGVALHWQLADVPAAGLRLSYQVRPLQSGLWPTNVHAEAEYTDGVGFRGRLTFPVPRVQVKGNRAVYLPILFQNRCPDRRFDFVLAIDTSSSMLESSTTGGETKLAAAVRAATGFLDYLRLPGDQVAVVAFNVDAQLVQGLTSDRALVARRLQSLPQAAGTRIDRGLEAADGELRSVRRRQANLPVVILLTDGRPTDGTIDAVRSRAQAMRRAGIVIFTIGLGADADGGLLVEMSGDGSRYSYAPEGTSLGAVYRTIALTVPCE